MKIDRLELADITNPSRIAQTIIKQLGEIEPTVPIEEIAYACGITTIKELTTRGFEGALIAPDDKSEGIILISRDQIHTRRRFTIAHELGHFMSPWHQPHSPDRGCTARDMTTEAERRTVNRAKKVEIEANSFAAEILMPTLLFRRIAEEEELTTRLIEKLALYFDVSKLAAARRLTKLSSEPCSVVVSNKKTVRLIYRSEEFPYIDIKPGMPVPSTVLSRKFDGFPGDHSDQEEVDPLDWEIQSMPKGTRLIEQVLLQINEYQLTLLYMDMSEVLDDDDEYAEYEASKLPYFH